MQIFVLCFIPLFVAMDVIGSFPIYIGLTSDMTQSESRKVARLAALTALIVGLLFIWFGNQIFQLLHVSTADFKIAGGLVLFIIAVTGILHDQPRHAGVVKEHVGIVPIGVPLMVGPATLVTLLLLDGLYPTWAVAAGLLANVFLSLIVFHFSTIWTRVLHINTIMAISKVVHFFLAAIAIMMIRVGILEIVQGL